MVASYRLSHPARDCPGICSQCLWRSVGRSWTVTHRLWVTWLNLGMHLGTLRPPRPHDLMIFGSPLRMMFHLGWPRFASSPHASPDGSVVSRPRVGLALGSGSARGWAHIGVIDALSEAGIEPDIVCGASMGALVGAAHVAGHLAELRQWAEGATWRKIVRLTDVRLSGGGLINGRQVVAFLRELGIGESIESYKTQYAAVATDMATGREIWLQSGPIHEAVRASLALPGILSPSRIDGKWLLDGGLSNP